MPHIAIIPSSVRTGSMSHRVALFFKKFIEAKNPATAEIPDLFDAEGNPADVAGVEKRATEFPDELLWRMEANRRMK